MNYNVIIADDFEHDIELVALELKRTRRFQIIHKAKDVTEVVQYLEGLPPFNDRDLFPLPHLLLLDLKMARVDGFQILRSIKEHAIRLVTLVVTGHDLAHFTSMARNFGAAAVFIKPLSAHDVQQMIVLADRLVARLNEDAAE